MSKVIIPAEALIKILDAIDKQTDDLRALASGGFTSKPSEEIPDIPDVRIDTSKIRLRIGKFADKKMAGPLDPRSWAFAEEKNGAIVEECRVLVEYIKAHGKYQAGGFEYDLDKSGKFLRRDKIKEASQ